MVPLSFKGSSLLGDGSVLDVHAVRINGDMGNGGTGGTGFWADAPCLEGDFTEAEEAWPFGLLLSLLSKVAAFSGNEDGIDEGGPCGEGSAAVGDVED